MIFRGTMLDSTVVFGYHLVNPHGQHCIYDPEIGDMRVEPESLAMSTGISDKNEVPVFGSFPVDGKMSEGGDTILYPWCGGTFSKGIVEYKKYDHGSSVVYPMRFICTTSDDDENGPEIQFDSRCEVIPKETENG